MKIWIKNADSWGAIVWECLYDNDRFKTRLVLNYEEREVNNRLDPEYAQFPYEALNEIYMLRYDPAGQKSSR